MKRDTRKPYDRTMLAQFRRLGRACRKVRGLVVDELAAVRWITRPVDALEAILDRRRRR